MSCWYNFDFDFGYRKILSELRHTNGNIDWISPTTTWIWYRNEWWTLYIQQQHATGYNNACVDKTYSYNSFTSLRFVLLLWWFARSFIGKVCYAFRSVLSPLFVVIFFSSCFSFTFHFDSNLHNVKTAKLTEPFTKKFQECLSQHTTEQNSNSTNQVVFLVISLNENFLKCHRSRSRIFSIRLSFVCLILVASLHRFYLCLSNIEHSDTDFSLFIEFLGLFPIVWISYCLKSFNSFQMVS